MTPDILARPPAAGLLQRFRLGALIQALIARDTRYRQMRQFARLDDRLLRDIGATRDDIGGLGL